MFLIYSLLSKFHIPLPGIGIFVEGHIRNSIPLAYLDGSIREGIEKRLRKSLLVDFLAFFVLNSYLHTFDKHICYLCRRKLDGNIIVFLAIALINGKKYYDVISADESSTVTS